MHLVRNSSKRERIWLGQDERTLVHGAYTNNSHVLACYDASGPEDAFISIVLSQYQKTNDMGYTLSVMCTEPFTLVQPQKDLPPIHDISSQWTAQSAGGPTGQDAFFNNPMYLIDIKDEKDRTAFQARCTVTKVLPGECAACGSVYVDAAEIGVFLAPRLEWYNAVGSVAVKYLPGLHKTAKIISHLTMTSPSLFSSVDLYDCSMLYERMVSPYLYSYGNTMP
mmetsp:Transcript_5329/g.14406  ORF Transcript_5329/g.14406 Transcript_5329/m.14406 type:complete len:223 (-) Transcript_5329:854-1522(-)